MIEKQKVEIKFPERYETVAPTKSLLSTNDADVSDSTAVSLTFNTSTKEVLLVNYGYDPIMVKYTDAVDTDDVTESNADLILLAEEKQYFPVNNNTGISYLSLNGTGSIFIIEY